MPEPTRTKLQEWERITSKLLDENINYYEEITPNEVNFVVSMYDANDELITSRMNQINNYFLPIIDEMLRHYYHNRRLNIYDKIESQIKLYLIIDVWLQFARVVNLSSNDINITLCKSLQDIIYFLLNKIPFIKKKIRRYLPTSNVKVIRLYDIFDKFIKKYG
jgi:hypothetical protein